MCYHRFCRAHDQTAEDRIATPRLGQPVEQLAEQLQWLASFCEFQTLEQLVSSPSLSSSWKVAVTLDDGFLDNLEFAMPVFESQNVPITWFVATRFIENPHRLPWWELFQLAARSLDDRLSVPPVFEREAYDLGESTQRAAFIREGKRILKRGEGSRAQRERAYEQVHEQLERRGLLPEGRVFIDRSELESLAQRPNVRFQGHTVSHLNMASSPVQEVRRELEQSRQRLADWTEQPPDWLAYPYGKVNQQAIRLAEQSGFQGAVTTSHDYLGGQTTRYTVPRLIVQPTWDLETFKSHVLALKHWKRLATLKRHLERLS